jgi:hypothetical protein
MSDWQDVSHLCNHTESKPKKLAYLGMKLANFRQIQAKKKNIYILSSIFCHDKHSLPKGTSFHQQSYRFGVIMDQDLVNKIDKARQLERVPRSAWLARAARLALEQRGKD